MKKSAIIPVTVTLLLVALSAFTQAMNRCPEKWWWKQCKGQAGHDGDCDF